MGYGGGPDDMHYEKLYCRQLLRRTHPCYELGGIIAQPSNAVEKVAIRIHEFGYIKLPRSNELRSYWYSSVFTFQRIRSLAFSTLTPSALISIFKPSVLMSPGGVTVKGALAESSSRRHQSALSDMTVERLTMGWCSSRLKTYS